MQRTKPVPRTHTHHCYICNSAVKIDRFPGGLQQRDVDGAEEARKGGYHITFLDYQSILCGSEDCVERYKSLPTPNYYQYRPLLRSGTFWDGGSIFGFPERNARPEVSDETINLDYRGENASKLESLFQEWLFFGLLNEVLGSIFRREDYIDEEMYLSTTNLDEKLLQWAVSRPEQCEYERIRDAVFLVSRMLSAAKVEKQFDEELMAFIAQAGEMCWGAVEGVFHGSERPAFGPFMPSWQQKRLVGIGWCPHEAASAIKLWTAISEQSAFANMERRQSSHSECVPEKCYDTKIESKHRQDCGGCETLRIDEGRMQQICSMIENDTFPVLMIDKDGIFRVIEHQINTEYCAISHVWTQGMGNEEDNALHRCQLKFLRNLTHLPIWLDTICCPVDRRAGRILKNKALSMMHTIYHEATRVLVIDTELGELDVLAMSPLELGCRVSLSKWASRLWTFQEGALPGELWIQFKDRPLDYYTLWLALREGRRSPRFRDRLFYGMASAFYATMRAVGGHLEAGTPQSLVNYFITGLGRRTATYAKDEAICTATLLGLDVKNILKHDDHENRMKALWQMLSDLKCISRNVAFSNAQTLSLPGYSWACSTFLGGNAIHCGAFDGAEYATTSDKGLLFRSSGFAIKLGEKIPGAEIASTLKSVNGLYVKSGHQWWMFGPISNDIIPLWDLLVPDMALLFRYPLGSARNLRRGACILVQMQGSGRCRRVRHGNFRRLGRAESANMVLAHAHAEQLRSHEDFLCLGSMAAEHLPAQYRRCETHLPFDQSLILREDIPQTIRDIGPSTLFYHTTLFMLAGEYAEMVEEFSEQQEWCLD